MFINYINITCYKKNSHQPAHITAEFTLLLQQLLSHPLFAITNKQGWISFPPSTQYQLSKTSSVIQNQESTQPIFSLSDAEVPYITSPQGTLSVIVRGTSNEGRQYLHNVRSIAFINTLAKIIHLSPIRLPSHHHCRPILHLRT